MRVISSKKAKINLAKAKSRQGYCGNCRGSLRIVGIGPGSSGHLTQRARRAIKESQVIVGYKTYIKLLGNLIAGKEVISSGMTQEIERAKCAINKAKAGKQVCLVSSGDPGIYGMAGLVLEILTEKQLPKIKIEIVPGVPAALACASLLGAPLMHDFAVISLSDLLTNKELIKKRVEVAAKGDFVLVFYNPRSKKRIALLKGAWEILLKYRSPKTPVGIVRNAYRDGQEITITELGKLNLNKVDMFTTIIVGNSQTYSKQNYMITPRGYQWA